MKDRFFLFLATFLFLAPGIAVGQGDAPFDVQAYRAYLSAHQNLGADQLQSMFRSTAFRATAAASGGTPAYLDSIDEHYALTAYEKELLGQHGFVVSSRLSKRSTFEALCEIYERDLPVFVSTDAILHAIHFSYDRILQDLERVRLATELSTLLKSLKNQLPSLEQRYGSAAGMRASLHDVDVYLTVPLALLGEQAQPYYSENATVIADLLAKIAALAPVQMPFFASTPRDVDFSQFTPRGHYTHDTYLRSYFQAMIWLGRTQLYLIQPAGVIPRCTEADVQRQSIDAVLVAEAVRLAGAASSLGMIDSTLKFLVGESDNVTFWNLETLSAAAGVDSASALLDTAKFHEFQNLLAVQPFAFERINSQILMSDPFDTTQVSFPSSFLLLGQRFVIDSYVTGSVVYDRIVYNGQKVRRMLPSTLDVLFALGNNAALQLLSSELDQYHYATNLAALRYLIDSYGEEFWTGSLFNSWLSMIRSLNPPGDRSSLPPFMQTAAWWQEKMNTQLASWAQLRHDNLLYAKQSYSGGMICSYPESYVEPVPEFFARVKLFAETAIPRFSSSGSDVVILSYFQKLAATADTLHSIAEKELLGTPLHQAEKQFLKSMLVRQMAGQGCSLTQDTAYFGWYPDLFYGVPAGREELFDTDFIVADVHTAPTDDVGNPVGWVLHVGAGPVDMAILNATTADGRPCSFIGPVLNYYERVTEDFKRLTDEEWKTLSALAPTVRPDFVNLYLADAVGQSRGEGRMLLTGVRDDLQKPLPNAFVLYQNYPNPFNPSTFITIGVPAGAGGRRVKLEVFNLQGQSIATLLDAQLPVGNYVVKWDGRTRTGKPVASGVFFSRLTAGGTVQTRKMVLLR